MRLLIAILAFVTGHHTLAFFLLIWKVLDR